MKSFITAILIGIVLGAGGYWAWHGSYRPPVIQPAATQTESPDAPARMEQLIKGKLEAMELRTESIRDELRDTGRVVRRRARDLGAAVVDTAADVTATTTIKTKLAADPELSAWNISVNTTAGVVTLSGTVDSIDLIGRAMLLALDTEHVSQVISTIQVRQSPTQPPP